MAIAQNSAQPSAVVRQDDSAASGIRTISAEIGQREAEAPSPKPGMTLGFLKRSAGAAAARLEVASLIRLTCSACRSGRRCRRRRNGRLRLGPAAEDRIVDGDELELREAAAAFGRTDVRVATGDR